MEYVSTSSPYKIMTDEPNAVYTVYDADGLDFYHGSLVNTSFISVDLQPILTQLAPKGIKELTRLHYDDFDIVAGDLDTEFSYEINGSDFVTNKLFYCTEMLTNEQLNLANGKIANDYIGGKWLNGSYFSLTYLHGSNTAYDGKTVVRRETRKDGTYEDITSGGTVAAPEISWRVCGDLGYIDDFPENPVVSFSLGVYMTDATPSSYRKLTPEFTIEYCTKDKYALYYVNTFGGIDWIVCDGKNSVTYNSDRHTVTRYADIDDLTEFGKQTYVNNTTRSWELNTSVMSDDDSRKMYRLFNSPCVWLYNAETYTMESVNIDDAALKIKTFSTENKLYNYTIKVTSSQTFTIR